MYNFKNCLYHLFNIDCMKKKGRRDKNIEKKNKDLIQNDIIEFLDI